MDYNAIRKMADDGLKFFTDQASPGFNHYLISGGGVVMVDGVEVPQPETVFPLVGVIRDINFKDIDGDTIRAGDKRGIFNADVLIERGNWIDVNGERFEVKDPRPIKPSGSSSIVAYRPILRKVAVYG